MDLRNRDIRLDEKSTNDIKMSLIQAGTWPTPQNVEQPYLKFRPRGICIPPSPPPPQEGLNTVPLTLQQEDCNLMLTLLLSNTLGYTEFWKQWSPGLSLGIQVCR